VFRYLVISLPSLRVTIIGLAATSRVCEESKALELATRTKKSSCQSSVEQVVGPNLILR
jgi:hypothetical protein